jgi:hypothetical protein
MMSARVCVGPLAVSVYSLVTCAGAAPPGAAPRVIAPTSPLAGVLYVPRPLVLHVAKPGPTIDSATISDIAVADFDGDGRKDIAVAWYATDNEDIGKNQRFLTIYFNDGATFTRGADIDLYIPDYDNEAYSVFRIGTGEIGVGDLDGDGDLDLVVAPFFGDELWFIENLGQRQFSPHLKFPFGFNSAGNFDTPPELLAGDFDGNGRVELVYLADPTLQFGGRFLHFWRTTSTIDPIARADWQGVQGAVYTTYTRGLAVADFDGDGRADLCFTGCTGGSLETSPILTFWYALNSATRRFSVRNEYPSIVCSDVVDIRPTPTALPGVILTDINGTTMQYWRRASTGMTFSLQAEVTGYAGLSPNRGMTAVVADVNGDGTLDLVTKQKLGTAQDRNQIEITLSSKNGAIWRLVTPTPIDTLGFENDAYNEILRPRNLAVADLLGNTLPEIVAGFGWSGLPGGTLDVAIWLNSCLGDVNRDGRTNGGDIAAMNLALGSCVGQPQFNADADLDKDGCVTAADYALLAGNLGCSCDGNSVYVPGDMNCDGVLNFADINAFIVALQSESAYAAAYPYCRWLNADCNGDGHVTFADIDCFLSLLDGVPGVH